MREGVTDPEAWAEAIDETVSAVFIGQPNFLGAVEDVGRLAAVAREHGALVVCSADPLTLGILEAPGEPGVDVGVGEGQSRGNRRDFGGP